MAEDQDSRTEDPTGKRQSEAWNKGNVALSREVSFAVSLLAGFTVFTLVLPMSGGPLLRAMRGLIEHPDQLPIDNPEELRTLAMRMALLFATALGPPMALFAVSGILAVVGQHGRFIWAPERLKPNWKIFNPMAALGRIFGKRSLIEFGKGLVKVGILGGVFWVMLSHEYMRSTAFVGMQPTGILPVFLKDLRILLLSSLGVAIVVAAADLVYQRWSHWKQLKMTKQEVKDEAKNSDGDPTIKSKQRARRQQRARQRMLKSVPTASVVITNPTHYAVALQYEKGMNAPKLVAKGVDHMAKRIRELATASDVPIIANPPLARAIHATVEIDQEIRPEHYKAVAEVIGYVMRLKRVSN